MQITFVELAMENHDKCRYDYVEVLNGGAASSPSIGGTFEEIPHFLRDKL